jgi:hypothetical protein
VTITPRLPSGILIRITHDVCAPSRPALVCTIAFVLLSGGSCRAAFWEGPLLKPKARENVFAFAEKPTFRKIGKDMYEIAFTSKGFCDAAVSVLDEKGRTVRYLAAGVLGANAPGPFQKGSLRQRLLWNGKDDFGDYVEEPLKCGVRVGLGLSPKLDKAMAWHPKDINGYVHAIGADADGVYVVTSPFMIKAFGHDMENSHTVHPWPADKFATGKAMDAPKSWPPGGEDSPRVGGYGIVLPCEGVCNLSIHDGLMLLYTVGWRMIKSTKRYGTNGTTRGQSLNGPTIAREKSHIYGSSVSAVSPDGKWVYYTPVGQGRWGGTGGAGKNNSCRNAVYRLAWDAECPLGQPFIGNEAIPKYAVKKDNRHRRSRGSRGK